MKITFLPPAEQELREAVDFYESLKEELGFEFFEEVWSSIERIERFPEGWQKLSRNARRCRTQRFPYGVVYQYRPEQDEILIVAISHLHRKPVYWKNRI